MACSGRVPHEGVDALSIGRCGPELGQEGSVGYKHNLPTINFEPGGDGIGWGGGVAAEETGRRESRVGVNDEEGADGGRAIRSRGVPCSIGAADIPGNGCQVRRCSRGDVCKSWPILDHEERDEWIVATIVIARV